MQVDIQKKTLNDLVINTLQNSLKQRGFINGMKKAIAAIVHHCSDNDNMDERSKFCPCNEKTWCRYQRDKITGESTYKSSIIYQRT